VLDRRLVCWHSECNYWHAPRWVACQGRTEREHSTMHDGQRFRQARIDSGVRLETIGHHTGLSVRTIRRYETCADWSKSNIPYGTVLILARLVELEPVDLIGQRAA
jgi:hypothetical protein